MGFGHGDLPPAFRFAQLGLEGPPQELDLRHLPQAGVVKRRRVGRPPL
jgi:hypothetical protein